MNRKSLLATLTISGVLATGLALPGTAAAGEHGEYHARQCDHNDRGNHRGWHVHHREARHHNRYERVISERRYSSPARVIRHVERPAERYIEYRTIETPRRYANDGVRIHIGYDLHL